MRKLTVLAALVALAIAAIPAFAATKTVKVDDNFFSPKTVTLKKGDKIKFSWTGDAPHNVKGAGINIGTRSSGTRTVTVKRAGKFVCTIHPGMEGRIRLR
jgi:plastocyanin